MNSNTPYDAPESEIIDQSSTEYAEIDLFSTSQRIGRVRYLAYNFASYFLILFVFGIGAAIIIPFISGDSNNVNVTSMGFAIVAFYVLPFIVSLILARRRLHDLGNTGWMGLLYLIPLVNLVFFLYLLFAPGIKGKNQYGLQPKPNTVGTWIFGLIAPIFIIGVLAAIAIPAYQDYTERAKSAQSGG